MNQDRIWILGSVAAIAIIAIFGWVVGIQPVLTSGSAADQQVASLTATNNASEASLASLSKEFANIGPLQAKLASLRLSVPEEEASAEFLQEIDAVAGKYNVKLLTLSIASATVYIDPAAAAAAAASSSASTSTATPAPTTATTTTTPTTTSTGLVLIPVSMSFSGSFENVREFIGAMQTGSRLYFASASNITAATGASNSANGGMSGDIFTLPGTASASPTATPTATPTSTATPVPTGTATALPTENATSTPTGKATTAP